MQTAKDRGLSSAALFLDMSKVLYKVPHLHSLSAVGVSGPLLKWFESYLSNCSQKVMLNAYSSTSLPVHSSAPQGSILGPLLFIIYINYLAELHLLSQVSSPEHCSDPEQEKVVAYYSCSLSQPDHHYCVTCKKLLPLRKKVPAQN